VSIPFTFDTGVLIAADRGDRAIWARIEAIVNNGVLPTIPTPVVTEAWRSSRQARLSRLLQLCRVEPLDGHTARRAGELCGRAGSQDPVDAVVVSSAAARGGAIWTADPDDLRVLVAHLPPGVPAPSVRPLR
jgi:predicted nucleic acid-binding protein